MKAHFELLARYNQWANARLYRMAGQLPDEAYRKDVGVYFGSLLGTLNHLLTADRIWMRRLTNTGEHPRSLNAIVFDDYPSLLKAREAEDERILAYVRGLSDAAVTGNLEYRTLNGAPLSTPICGVLAHLFNHQTHHRGQAHAVLTVLGVKEPEPLDLLIMLRER